MYLELAFAQTTSVPERVLVLQIAKGVSPCQDGQGDSAIVRIQMSIFESKNRMESG
jgi:hypothetical protein